MVIQHNVSALNANRQLGILTGQKAASTEKLSSGYRINRSADDAAGLSISEKMRKQIRGLDRGATNIEDGISYAQTADGALNEVHDMLQRINELAIQAANGTNSATDRAYINNEVQDLKTEMERVFTTTFFNEKQIWKEDITIHKNVVGQIKVQSTTIATPYSQSLTIDNDNFGLLPASRPNYSYGGLSHSSYNVSSYYTIHADPTDGVYLSWSAFNGTNYKTKTISWDELRDNNFQFNIGNYFENKDSDGNAITDPAKQLLNADGSAKFGFDVAFKVETGASNEQIATAINNTTMQQSLGSPTSFEDEGKTLNNAGITCSATFVYAAAYADSVLAKEKGVTGYDFETPSDSFIEPVKNANGSNLTKKPSTGADLAAARTSTESWEFAFQAAGLGQLTAKPTQCAYSSRDTRVTTDTPITSTNVTSVNWTGDDEDDEDIFWYEYSIDRWNYSTQQYDRYWYHSALNIPSGTGTLGDVMGTLTGRNGLLSKEIQDGPSGNKGGTDLGGTFNITFDITSDTPYTYGKDADGNDLTSNIVGSFTLSVTVSPSDTEESILKRLNQAFTDTTLFDLNFNSKNTVRVYHDSTNYHSSTMWKNDFLPQDSIEDINLNIHSGSETKDKIFLDYECLRLSTIGMSKTNVLTEEDALAAIDEVASALEIISAQRSLFGAYQNRMEHAYSIDKNSSENTQSAESKIRDTDMAKEMVNYSNLNILGQAGQSMLAQANHKNQGILSLIQ